MTTLIKKLYSMLDKKARGHLSRLVFSMAVASILEAFSISMLLLFIRVVNDALQSSTDFSLPWLNTFYAGFGFSSPSTFLIVIGIVLFLLYLFKNVLLFFQMYFQNKFMYEQQARISNLLLAGYLRSPYTFHIQRNTAEILRNITSATDAMFGNGINPIMTMATELFVIGGIAIVLLVLEPVVTITAFLIIGVLVGLFFKIVRNKLGVIGHNVQDLSTKIILWTNQGLGGIKEIKLLGRERYFENIFSQYRFAYAKNLTFMATLQKLPRLYLEIMLIGGMLLIMSILIARGEAARDFIPVIGLFAMASVRLMPSISQIVSSLNSLKFGTAAIDDIYNDMNLFTNKDSSSRPMPDVARLNFAQEIRLQDMTYIYPESSTPALRQINLAIPCGKSVAFVGPSGAGKTTVIDIILGLLKPTRGKLLIDGRDLSEENGALFRWQKNIGYIPQNIYLIDDTLRRNIAFGIADNEINDAMVRKVVKDSHLEEFISTLPAGLDTKVGERGVRLSGGQCQRIGIARALYHDPPVLVMDEATSSLDNETESEISSAIEELSGKKTVIIIAHRLSTVKKCTTLFYIKDAMLVDSGSFDELLSENEDFRRMATYSKGASLDNSSFIRNVSD